MRDSVLVIIGRQTPENERHGNDVLDAMIAVGGVMQWTGFADNADGRLLRGKHNPLDLIEAILDERVQLHRTLGGGLGMKLRGERDLEQHVFHHIEAVRARTLEPRCP